MALLTLADVERAREALERIIHRTPLDLSQTFSRMADNEVFLKMENLQKTGSFKIRGAYNKIESLSAAEKGRGVIAASAGNHAQGVAYAAARAGLRATIVMPEVAPLSKIGATRGYGPEVVLAGQVYDEAFRRVLIPRKNGKVAFQEIRALRSGAKAIFMSGYAADIVREKDLLEESMVLLNKPILPQDLLRQVREVLDS